MKRLFDGGKLQLFGVVLVDIGMEVYPAAGFVEANCSYDDEFLALAKPLRVDGWLSADHTDSGELGDLVGECHQIGDRTEGLVREGRIEAREDDSLAKVNKLEGERDDIRVEELHLVDANDIHLMELVAGKEIVAEAIAGRGDDGGVMGVLRVASNCRAMVPEVDIGLVAGHALTRNSRALKASDQLLGLAREHGAGDDLDAAGSRGHVACL
jgi:hypothetical protein